MWVLRLLGICCGVWLRRWRLKLSKLVEKELAEAKRGARAEELAAVRDILYED
jgi:hypothetical protein